MIKTYLIVCYQEIIDLIRKHVVGNTIWASVGESTDVECKFIANVFVGTLLVDTPGDRYLLTSEVFDKVNFSTIVKIFDTSMFLLCQKESDVSTYFLFISDAAPYMTKLVQL